MLVRQFYVRLALRAMLWSSSRAQRRQLRQVLGDSDLMAGLTGALVQQAAMEYGLADDTPVLDWFQWLMDHSDEIFAIITRLLIIFTTKIPVESGSVEVARSSPEAVDEIETYIRKREMQILKEKDLMSDEL